MRKYFLYIIISVAGLSVLKGCKVKASEKKAKVVCYYMGYACGDCYAKYKIKEVLSSSNIDEKDLLEKDLKILFAITEVEKRLDSLISKCAICYNFYFEGKIYKNGSDSFYSMKTDTFSIRLRDKNCCD